MKFETHSNTSKIYIYTVHSTESSVLHLCLHVSAYVFYLHYLHYACGVEKTMTIQPWQHSINTDKQPKYHLDNTTIATLEQYLRRHTFRIAKHQSKHLKLTHSNLAI